MNYSAIHYTYDKIYVKAYNIIEVQAKGAKYNIIEFHAWYKEC